MHVVIKTFRYEQINDNIRRVLDGFKKWRVVHVKREVNEAAQGLAKIAAPEKTDKVWVEDIPNSIFFYFFSTVTLELLALFV